MKILQKGYNIREAVLIGILLGEKIGYENAKKEMEQEIIIQSLFNMLQKSNSEKINMQLTIDKLTHELQEIKKEDKKEIDKNEK